jgi:hypothetical protein
MTPGSLDQLLLTGRGVDDACTLRESKLRATICHVSIHFGFRRNGQRYPAQN